MTPEQQCQDASVLSACGYELGKRARFVLSGNRLDCASGVHIAPIPIDSHRSIVWTVHTNPPLKPIANGTRLMFFATPRLESSPMKESRAPSDPKSDVDAQALSGDLIGDMNVTVSFVEAPTGSVSISQVGFAENQDDQEGEENG